jgi:hypothetical protein
MLVQSEAADTVHTLLPLSITRALVIVPKLRREKTAGQ